MMKKRARQQYLMLLGVVPVALASLILFFYGAKLSADVLAVKDWRGEYFKKKEGGLYVKTVTAGFKNAATANVQVTLFGILQQQNFTFSNSQTAVKASPREIWKFPSGKYRVERIELIDGAGLKRSWVAKANAPVSFVVPRVMLSNLGLWTLSPQGANGLNVNFAMVPNSYSEKGEAKDSSVAAVVNGFTGSIQQVIGGKKVVDGAEREYSDDNSLRATATFTRQISMFYRVDLFKHNKYSKDVMAAIAAFDPNLRGCFTHALDANANLKGELVFQVIASAKTGTIRQARKSKGSINDGSMIDCMIGELQQIPMPVQENMIGELTFMFDAK